MGNTQNRKEKIKEDNPEIATAQILKCSDRVWLLWRKSKRLPLIVSRTTKDSYLGTENFNESFLCYVKKACMYIRSQSCRIVKEMKWTEVSSEGLDYIT